jgi:hypothetical protein
MALRSFEQSPLIGARVVRDVLGALAVTTVAVALVWAATSTPRRVCMPVLYGWSPHSSGPDERCATLSLEPSPLALATLMLILAIAILRVLHRAQTAEQAHLILARAVTTIVIVAAVTVVVSQVWLWVSGYPEGGPGGALMVVPPFPFAGASAVEDTMSFLVMSY